VDSESFNLIFPDRRAPSDAILLIVEGKNHILHVKNIKIPLIFIKEDSPSMKSSPMIIVNKMDNLNQKGNLIIGKLLNMFHEMCIPPKMAKGSNIDIPPSIKGS